MLQNDFKLRILSESNKFGLKRATEKYGVNYNTAKCWDKNRIIAAIKEGKKKCGVGRKSSYGKEIEDSLVKFTVKKLEKKRAMKRDQLKAKALIQVNNQGFKASDGWVTTFLKRNGIRINIPILFPDNLPKYKNK